jgi:hypothetical protein
LKYEIEILKREKVRPLLPGLFPPFIFEKENREIPTEKSLGLVNYSPPTKNILEDIL